MSSESDEVTFRDIEEGYKERIADLERQLAEERAKRETAEQVAARHRADADRAEREYNKYVNLNQDRSAQWHTREAALTEEKLRADRLQRELVEANQNAVARELRIHEALSLAVQAVRRAEAAESLLAAQWPALGEDDRPLPEDAAIEAAYPTRSGSHREYAEAMRLVGARRSKGGLVALVNWLLLCISKGGG